MKFTITLAVAMVEEQMSSDAMSKESSEQKPDVEFVDHAQERRQQALQKARASLAARPNKKARRVEYQPAEPAEPDVSE